MMRRRGYRHGDQRRYRRGPDRRTDHRQRNVEYRHRRGDECDAGDFLRTAGGRQHVAPETRLVAYRPPWYRQARLRPRLPDWLEPALILRLRPAWLESGCRTRLRAMPHSPARLLPFPCRQRELPNRRTIWSVPAPWRDDRNMPPRRPRHNALQDGQCGLAKLNLSRWIAIVGQSKLNFSL
jgi:hypothetical protein